MKNIEIQATQIKLFFKNPTIIDITKNKYCSKLDNKLYQEFDVTIGCMFEEWLKIPYPRLIASKRLIHIFCSMFCTDILTDNFVENKDIGRAIYSHYYSMRIDFCIPFYDYCDDLYGLEQDDIDEDRKGCANQAFFITHYTVDKILNVYHQYNDNKKYNDKIACIERIKQIMQDKNIILLDNSNYIEDCPWVLEELEF